MGTSPHAEATPVPSIRHPTSLLACQHTDSPGSKATLANTTDACCHCCLLPAGLNLLLPAGSAACLLPPAYLLPAYLPACLLCSAACLPVVCLLHAACLLHCTGTVELLHCGAMERALPEYTAAAACLVTVWLPASRPGPGTLGASESYAPRCATTEFCKKLFENQVALNCMNLLKIFKIAHEPTKTVQKQLICLNLARSGRSGPKRAIKGPPTPGNSGELRGTPGNSGDQTTYVI